MREDVYLINNFQSGVILNKKKNKHGVIEEVFETFHEKKTNDKVAVVEDKTKRQKVKPITFKNNRQRELFDVINNNTITIVTGPAGTAKTFISVYVGLKDVLQDGKKRKRLIISRPVVEAGESLGYLPGSMEEKIGPYLSPIFDSIVKLVGPQNKNQLMKDGIIEICPLAFMRGRTMSDFVILDEAQNATFDQIFMTLTRIDENAKIVITGDLSQTDLHGNKKSGLLDWIEILRGIEGAAIFEFQSDDIVRHPIVKDIVENFDKFKKEKEGKV